MTELSFRDASILVVAHALITTRADNKPGTMQDILSTVGALVPHLCAAKQAADDMDEAEENEGVADKEAKKTAQEYGQREEEE